MKTTTVHRHRRIASAMVLLACGGLVAGIPDAIAGACAVPSTAHQSISAAVADPSCTAIQVAAGLFPEVVEIGRDLAVDGAGAGATTIAGVVRASGAGTEVALTDLTVDGTAAAVAGCWPSALDAIGGARIAVGGGVVVRNTAAGGAGCRLFADGFESGNIGAWSAVLP